jgi:RNA recognition motif-containing protein
MRLYVGNISFRTSEKDLLELFQNYGGTAPFVVREAGTNTSRGFAFIDVTERLSLAAIKELDGREFQGRVIKIAPAKQRRPEDPAYA